MERIDDLGVKKLKIIQDTDLFCFGMDAVLLANFAKASGGDIVVDLCSGNGIIPILLTAKTNAKKIVGVELQKEPYDLANRSIELNGISDRVEMINDDIKNVFSHIGEGKVNAVTCNPPYMTGGVGKVNPNDAVAIARHEIATNLDEVVRIASRLLKFGGSFYMVHRADRLCDIICAMRERHIEPKRIRFVHPRVNASPNLILIEGKSGAKPGIIIDNPLYVYNDDGTYTDEINKIYEREI